jgi:hypothetical protein
LPGTHSFVKKRGKQQKQENQKPKSKIERIAPFAGMRSTDEYHYRKAE